MLFSREYKPNDDTVIYHYCSPQSFFAICSNKNIWFSDVFSMNDGMEVHWGYSIFEKASSSLLENIKKEFFDDIDDIIHSTSYNILPTVSCFSKQKDLLSQWRAYADDGQGFAIGFSARDILGMPVRALDVLYSDSQQISEVAALLKAIYDVEMKAKNKKGKDFQTICQTLAVDFCALKNPAFAEEQEVRLVHALRFEKSGSFLKLCSDGGTAWKKKYKPDAVKFRMKNEIPVPYVSIDFTNRGRINPIKEVVLGPKNRNLETNISVFLETIGLNNVVISKSSASYQ